MTGRILDMLIRGCREDHLAAVAEAGPEVRDRILEAHRVACERAPRDPGRVGGELFASIVAEKGLGRGRLLLAVVATLVFWDLNGKGTHLRDGPLPAVVRRIAGRRRISDRVAVLIGERGRDAGV